VHAEPLKMEVPVMFVAVVKLVITFITLLITIWLYVRSNKLAVYKIAALSVLLITFTVVKVESYGA